MSQLFLWHYRRHLLLSLNRIFNSYFWNIVIDCFVVGHQMTLAPLRQLMTAFTGLSVNSDLARIKIMTTRTDKSSEYTRKRARQIFFVSQAQGQMPSLSGGMSAHALRSADLKSMAGGDGLDNRDFNIIVETCTGLNQRYRNRFLRIQ